MLSNIFCCKAVKPTEAKFRVEFLWAVRMKVCSNGPGYVTKITAMPIHGKKSLKIFSETSRPMTFKLSIQHMGLGPYKICSNDVPELILTYFTARSTLPTNAFVWKNA